MTKRKPTFAQALALEKAQAAARRARRQPESELTPEQNAEWEAQKKEALRRRRENKKQS